MTSARQAAANRANAAHSTGPRTAEGKARAKLNALRHGLTGQLNIMPEEDLKIFTDFCAGLVDSLAPANPMERQLAQSIAEDSWRLNRGRAIENNILALGYMGEESEVDTRSAEIQAAVTAARVFINKPEQFRLITLYAQRTNGDIQKNLATLQRLQAEREARRLAELEEAAALRQSYASEGLPYDDQSDRKADGSTRPPANGFVFSNREIDLYIARQHRLKQARRVTPKEPEQAFKAAA